MSQSTFTSEVYFHAGSPSFEPVNPFAQAARLAPMAVADDAPPGTYTYTLVKSAPDVPAAEVEVAAIDAIEVMILWGTSVLHVAHLTPPRSFHVGESESGELISDFLLPAERLGVTRMPIVLDDARGTRVVIPAKARGSAEIAGRARISLDQVRALSRPCEELPGAMELELRRGTKLRMELDGFGFHVAAVAAGKRAPRALASAMDRAIGTSFGLSLLTTAALVTAAAFFVPPLGLTDDEMSDQDRVYAIQPYIDALAERERDRQKDETAENAKHDDEGGTGTRAQKEEGQMGNPTVHATSKRFSVKGPPDNQDVRLSHQAALREAQHFGFVGLLTSGVAGDPNAPTVPWGGDETIGNDPESHRGNMWGDDIGDAFGAGGLGLTGIGEGGGGRGEGIGLGNIGTYGHGAGLGPGQGFGKSAGRLLAGHATKSPRVRPEPTTVLGGRLPPEVVQRIVRQNFGRFRMCYEEGLARNPNLTGRVAARFVIDRTGAVSTVKNGGSDLPDSGVVSCVLSAFYGLSFPVPEGGIVSVVYPIALSPG